MELNLSSMLRKKGSDDPEWVDVSNRKVRFDLKKYETCIISCF